MKHTYVDPLPTDAVFLWRAGRQTANDLFGSPADLPDEWMRLVALDEELGAAREALSRLIEGSDRVCLGRWYCIPRSLHPQIADIEEGVHASTREVTGLLWDAPFLEPSLRNRVEAALGLPDAAVPGRDPAADITRFLRVHAGQRLIPFWM
ncbi:hypothetical protein [Streptomyces californicus]|uniref:hypothetical protein n=1 Tax=Streptomyces californicus TaxID=67351 RepID=UPI00296EEC20|nr:hypothetical protein [Streptomyces californicus]MDW4912542.1 hypothetical protein [Streptomyces californicus]